MIQCSPAEVLGQRNGRGEREGGEGGEGRGEERGLESFTRWVLNDPV